MKLLLLTFIMLLLPLWLKLKLNDVVDGRSEVVEWLCVLFSFLLISVLPVR